MFLTLHFFLVLKRFFLFLVLITVGIQLFSVCFVHLNEIDALNDHIK